MVNTIVVGHLYFLTQAKCQISNQSNKKQIYYNDLIQSKECCCSDRNVYDVRTSYTVYVGNITCIVRTLRYNLRCKCAQHWRSSYINPLWTTFILLVQVALYQMRLRLRVTVTVVRWFSKNLTPISKKLTTRHHYVQQICC